MTDHVSAKLGACFEKILEIEFQGANIEEISKG